MTNGLKGRRIGPSYEKQINAMLLYKKYDFGLYNIVILKQKA